MATADPISDPKIIGPGIWVTIHLLAYKKDKIFPDYMRFLSESFPCTVCRDHIRKYISAYPVPTGDNEFFKWSWQFHNEVNIRLNKPYTSLNTALSLWNGVQ